MEAFKPGLPSSAINLPTTLPAGAAAPNTKAPYDLAVSLMYSEHGHAIELFQQVARAPDSNPDLKKEALKNIVLSEFHSITEHGGYPLRDTNFGMLSVSDLETRNEIIHLACDSTIDQSLRAKAAFVFAKHIPNWTSNKHLFYLKLAISLDPHLQKICGLDQLNVDVEALDVTGKNNHLISFQIKVDATSTSGEKDGGGYGYGGGISPEIIAIKELHHLGAIALSEEALAELRKIPDRTVAQLIEMNPGYGS